MGKQFWQTSGRGIIRLNNLASNAAFAEVKARLSRQMEEELKTQEDPRILGNGAIFDQYQYAHEACRDFYGKFLRGETPNTGWVSPTDYENSITPEFFILLPTRLRRPECRDGWIDAKGSCLFQVSIAIQDQEHRTA